MIITARASHGEHGFKFLPQLVEVRANLAREYGYSVVQTSVPTVLDGLVAMHVQQYGQSFAVNPGAYLRIERGLLKRAFAEPAFRARFYLNGRMPENTKGIGYTADKAPLSDGDQFEFWIYTDPSGTCFDFYTYFDKSSVSVQEGESFSLRLFGYMAMGKDYVKMGFVNPKEAMPQPIYSEKYEVGMYFVNRDGSLGKRLGFITNNEGRFQISNLNPGSYLLTAAGNKKKRGFYKLILPYCKVEVLSAKGKRMRGGMYEICNVI